MWYAYAVYWMSFWWSSEMLLWRRWAFRLIRSKPAVDSCYTLRFGRLWVRRKTYSPRPLCCTKGIGCGVGRLRFMVTTSSWSRRRHRILIQISMSVVRSRSGGVWDVPKRWLRALDGENGNRLCVRRLRLPAPDGIWRSLYKQTIAGNQQSNVDSP